MEEIRVEENVSDGAASNIRTDLIETAVKFLKNPRVLQRPASEKEAFLLKKGLTRAEITEAFQQSGTNTNVEQHSQIKMQGYQLQNPATAVVKPSRWLIVRDIGNAIILIAGASYGLVYLYKRFIAPLIFGQAPRKKSLAQSINEMNTCITELSANLNATMQNVLEALNQMNRKGNENLAISELKNEIATIKGLLLSSRQFPAPPPLARPSIPSWQLQIETSKTEQVVTSSGTQNNRGETAAASSPLSSSPEIISVDEAPPNNQAGGGNLTAAVRDASESSETGSSEMVDVAVGVSGEDTD